MTKTKEYDWRSPEARRERFVTEEGQYTIRDVDGHVMTDEEIMKQPLHPSVKKKPKDSS